MRRTLIGLLILGNIVLVSAITRAVAQAPDGTVKITNRSVAQGVGLSWGDGVLSYKGTDYPFTFQATGLFRDVEVGITAAELSGQVFDLKSLEAFSGNYKVVSAGETVVGGGSRALIKNQNGVVVNLVATTEGRKFNLGPDGMTIELKK